MYETEVSSSRLLNSEPELTAPSVTELTVSVSFTPIDGIIMGQNLRY